MDRLVVLHSKKCHEVHLQRLVKIYKSVGVGPRDLCLNLCSYSLNSGGRLMEAAYKGAGAGVIPLGVLDSPAKVGEAVRLIRQLEPTVINSYTNQLFDLFEALGEKHSVRKCIVNGEPLTSDFRSRIERLGGVAVHDHYGAMECSGFAIARKHTDAYMKVFDDGLFFEVLRDDGVMALSGTGALIVTDLENRSMPFIRYRLGDRVDLRQRKDGLYIKVLGRLSDSVLVDGQVCSSLALIRIVQEVVGHPHFYFIVEKDPVTYKDKVILSVRPQDVPKAALIRSALKALIDPGKNLLIRSYPGAVPKTSTGKFQHFIDARKNI
jgi:phenylacetate-CoA ligase